MKIFLAVFFILASVLFAGCEQVKTVAKNELIEKAKTWKEPKVAIWYYAGSNDGFDYFKYMDLGIDETYRVSSKEGLISELNRIPLTNTHNKWVVMPWGTQDKKEQIKSELSPSPNGFQP